MVKVTFSYDPEEPDDHSVGMSDEEYARLLDALAQLGGYDVEVERVGADGGV